MASKKQRQIYTKDEIKENKELTIIDIIHFAVKNINQGNLYILSLFLLFFYKWEDICLKNYKHEFLLFHKSLDLEEFSSS